MRAGARAARHRPRIVQCASQRFICPAFIWQWRCAEMTSEAKAKKHSEVTEQKIMNSKKIVSSVMLGLSMLSPLASAGSAFAGASAAPQSKAIRLCVRWVYLPGSHKRICVRWRVINLDLVVERPPLVVPGPDPDPLQFERPAINPGVSEQIVTHGR
jgi:hypothetical protein